MKKTTYLLLTTAILLISFLLYSSRFYPLLNSDDALNILMTYYYKLPRDLYCWGQDRGGTLIPLIARIFYKGFGLSPVLAVSFANYLLLILGYAGFSSLLKKNSTRLLLAVAWFLPPLPFVNMMRFPLGMEYSLIGFSFLLLSQIRRTSKGSFLFHLLLAALVMVWTAALWVADTALLTLFLLGGVLLLAHHRTTGVWRPDRRVLVWTAGGLLAAGLFLFYARSFVTHTTADYLRFNTPTAVVQALHIFAGRMTSVLIFRAGNAFLSLYTWLLLFLFFFLLHALLRHRIRHSSVRWWLLFFTADLTALGGVIFLSRWVFLNRLGPWYFVPLYIDGLLILFLLTDHLKLKTRDLQKIRVFIAATLLTGALSTVYHLRYVSPGTLRPEITLRREFLKKAPVGIIAGYWNAYITAAADPARIKATPHDKDKNRNPAITKEVFAMPRLLVIGDMWLDTFPDTLRQYGHTLIKKGDPFRMGGCRVQEYRQQ